jgi:uncharacterized membrane protein YvbJ
MSYCPKCGNKVDDSMTFCPKCGASLKMETSATPPYPPQTYRRNEKNEKQEKNQQNEKREKQEKGEYSFIGWLIGGIIVIAIGVFAIANAFGYITSPVQNAIILVVIGILLVIVAIWMSMRTRRHNPVPPV